MKQKCFMVALLIMSALMPGNAYLALAQPGSMETGIGIGAHYHIALSELEDTDFDNDYLSYILGLKFRFNYMWTIDTVVEYYPSDDDISYILSPRLSLLYGGGVYIGTGIEKKYVKLESGESDWDDETYLAQVGFEIPLGEDNALNIDAYYGLEDFSDISDIISDFDSDNLTFGLRFYHYF